MSWKTSTISNKASVRDSNVELLRIFAIMGVVVLHYNGYFALSLVEPNSLNFYILIFLEGLFICAVNLFVLISGYFLSSTTKRKSVKAIELVVQVIAMSAVTYIVSFIISHHFSFKGLALSLVPNNYFVTLYITLYLISPYINLALSRLSEKFFLVLLAVLFVLFAVWPTVMDVIVELTGKNYNGLYTTNSGGSQFGYSIINFVLMYITGAFLRRKAPVVKKRFCILGIVLTAVLIFIWQLYMPSIARAYCNPLVVLLAVLVFLLFRGFNFKSRLINTLSKSSFTCFLIHGIFLSRIKIELFVNASPILLLLHILASAVAIYLVSFVVWAIYDFVTKPIFKLLGSKLGRLDALLSPEQSI